MKFLIDEDLSQKVAERLRIEGGLDVIHVRERDLLGKLDLIILQRAYEEDRILVRICWAAFR
jgi:predicted nuclease of predicted toxin-antitoxin system